jgi:hypothetical protein
MDNDKHAGDRSQNPLLSHVPLGIFDLVIRSLIVSFLAQTLFSQLKVN